MDITSRGLNTVKIWLPIQVMKIKEALKTGTLKVRDKELFKELLNIYEQLCAKSNYCLRFSLWLCEHVHFEFFSAVVTLWW